MRIKLVPKKSSAKMKSKKMIASATRYKREEQQASTSGCVLRIPRATRSNNKLNSDAEKNIKREVPDLILKKEKKENTTSAANLEKNYQKELSEQEKKYTNLIKWLDIKEKEITELNQLLNDLKKNLNELEEEKAEQKKKYTILTSYSELKKKEIIELKQLISDLQKNLSELKEEKNKENTSLLSSLELKQKEITDLKKSVSNLKKNISKFKKENIKVTKSLKKENENFQIKIRSLQRGIQKSKLQKDKNDKLLQRARQLCKHDFNSKIRPNFVQANSDLITDVVKLYESCFHGDQAQHCPAIQYMNSVPEPIKYPRHIENINGSPLKRRKIDNSINDINKHYSQNSLKELVMNLEPRHSDVYKLWRNVLWALNQYGREIGYNTLEIADCFSKHSSKYKNFQDVKKTFEYSDGTLSLPYLIEISKIYEEELDAMTEYLNDILPSRYVPLTINQVDIRDRRKFRLDVNSDDESHTLFIIPDLCVLTNEDGERLSFLQKKITSKNSELASLCPEMAKGFKVILKNEFYEFEARNNPSVSMKLHHPLKPAKSYIILPNGKEDNKEIHLSKIQRVLRAEAIKLLSEQTGKEFGDDDDDNNMVIMPDKDSNTIRTDVELVEALFAANPNMKNRYLYSGKTIYHCNSGTNLWCQLSEKAFVWHLRKNFKTTLKLTKAEEKYIGMTNTIIRIRNLTLGEIENIDIPNLLDSNFNLFITNNKAIVTSSISPVIRNIEKEDLAETTCGWSYNNELSKKHMKSVQSYFKKLIPQQCEREWFLSFIANMLNGQRINKYFLVLTDKRENKSGISTLMCLLATVFGNYYIANTKFVLAGGNRGNNQYDGGIFNLKGKRLLVADKLQKTDTLNCGFIKAITGESNYYIQDKNKFGRTQFKFPVQAGLIMSVTEEDVPKFDRQDQDFVKRMVAFPMRSQFVSKQEYRKLIRKADKTEIHIANDSLKRYFPEWSSAVLDLLVKHYRESLPPIPQSMEDLKEKLCDENYNYYNLLNSHVCRDENNHEFVTAKQIMGIIKQSPGCSNNPYEVQKLKLAMSEWAKARRTYINTNSTHT